MEPIRIVYEKLMDVHTHTNKTDIQTDRQPAYP